MGPTTKASEVIVRAILNALTTFATFLFKGLVRLAKQLSRPGAGPKLVTG